MDMAQAESKQDEEKLMRTYYSINGEQLNFDISVQLDVVGSWVVCDVCGNILRHTDSVPYCDYLCNLKVVKKKNKSTSKKR